VKRAPESLKRQEKNRGPQQPRETGAKRSGQRSEHGTIDGRDRGNARAGRQRRGRNADGQRGRARGGSRTRGRS
jgi:hypothetical protein